MKNVQFAIVSCDSMSNYKTELPNEDELLLKFLSTKQVDAKLVIWDDTSIQWESFDLIMLKSPWDYFNKPVEFRSWLDKMKEARVNLFNSAEVVKWNMDKIYLEDLEKSGIPVIPTVWLNKESTVSIQSIMKELNVNELIIKPRISGASKNTFKVTEENWFFVENRINELIQFEDFIAQPFLKEVMEGEYSFLFFNGIFSHAVVETPHKDDFRVQHYFGGSIQPFTPDNSILNQAQLVSDSFASDCLYARVDGILKDGLLHIIELEVIEPMLYLDYHPQACENLLEAMKNRIGHFVTSV